MEEVVQKLEERIIDLLSRMDDGDEKALEELKTLKKAVNNLNEFMSFVDDDDTMDTVKKKMYLLEKKFDEFLMDLNKVVG